MYKNVLYANTCWRTHLPTCTLWGMAWFFANVSQQLGYSLFFSFSFFYFKLGSHGVLIDCHSWRVVGMSQYLQPWLFWSSSPSTSGVPKITAMLCQTKHPLSGLKQSTNKKTGGSRHHCNLQPSLLYQSNNRNVLPVSMTFTVIPSHSFGFLSSKLLY